MARVTVEDCLKVIPNRFELVLLASQRAKQIINGSPILYKTNKKEKAHVVALREIGNNLLSPELINDSLREQIKNKMVFKMYSNQNDIDDSKDYNSQEINVDEISASGSTDDSIEDIDEDDSDYNNIDLDNSIDLDDNEE